MTQLNPTFQSWSIDDQSWLYSDEDFERPMPCTLDLSLFTQATHFPNYYLPSGLELGTVTATGLFGPFNPAASDGRQNFAGYLLNAVPLRDYLLSGATAGNPIASYLNGANSSQIVLSRLPIATQLTGTQQTNRILSFIFLPN